MAEVTNRSTVGITLVLKSGEAVTIQNGDTENIAYDPDNEHNKQMIAMGAIEVAGKPAPTSDAPASKSSRRSRK